MKLLLAEDEKELSNALIAILQHNQYTVDALEYIQAEKYDGVILDVMMPQMNGFDVLKTIRKEGNTVPVLILTAKAEIDDRVYGLDGGADDYLTKPFDTKELLARIRSITRRKTNAVSSFLKLGNVKLDCASFILSCGTNELRLRGKEYQIMEMFMSYPGQIFSVEKIMDHIWGYDSEAKKAQKMILEVLKIVI